MSHTPCGPNDPCGAFDETGIPCAPGVQTVVSDGTDCGPTDVSGLLPTEAAGGCTATGETITVGTAAGACDNPPTNLSMTEIERGQWGNVVFYTGQAHEQQIATNLFPQTFNVPAVTNPGSCMMTLQVSHGAGGSSSISGASVTISDNVNYTAPNTAFLGLQGSGGIATSLFMFDPVAGGTGSTVTLDFTDNTENPHGVVSYFWLEVCDTSATPCPITKDSFDFSGLVEDTSTIPLGTSGGASTSVTNGPINMGDCPALWFATGRHVRHNNNDKTNNADTDWIQITDTGTTTLLGSETLDVVSVDDRWSCQMGSGAGVIPANSGDFDWTYNSNFGVGSVDGVPDTGMFYALPLDCDSFTAQAETETTTGTCTISLANPNCLTDGVVKCRLTGSVTLCPSAGATISATPIVNGVALTEQTVAYESDAIEATCATFPVSFPITDLGTVLAPAASATHDFAWEVTGIGDATFSDWQTECEVIPV